MNRRDDNSLRYSEEFSTGAPVQAQAQDYDTEHDPDHLNRELPSFGKSREFRSFGTHDGSHQSTNNSNYSNYSGSGSGSASALSGADGDGSHNDNSSYGTTFLRPSFVMAKDVDAVYNNNKNYTYLTSSTRSESSSSCTEVTDNTATTPVHRTRPPASSLSSLSSSSSSSSKMSRYYNRQQRQQEQPIDTIRKNIIRMNSNQLTSRRYEF